MKYTDAKKKIDLFIQKKYPDFYKHPEYNAAITHWMQNTEFQYPYLPTEIFESLFQIFQKSPLQKNEKSIISEIDTLYQPQLSFMLEKIPFLPPGNPKFTFIDLFAGIGGFRIAFQNQGGKCVFSSEWDKYAQKTYEANFGEVPFGDINEITNFKKQVPDHDILCAGFPCQAFSIAGYRHGFNDKKGRGNLFFKIENVLLDKKPRAFLLENVKNLEKHDKKRTFEVIKNKLENAGYNIFHKVLNSMEYGNTPQTRERFYIVGFRKDIVNCYDYKWPNKVPLTKSIRDIIVDKVDKKYYYKRFDCYKELKNVMKSLDTVYQWRRVYTRENKSNVCPTLTANMGTGGHNVPLIIDGKPTNKDIGNIRKLTPLECARLQGYPDDFHIPHNFGNCHLYKQFGNSVTVPVVERIAKEIIKVL